MTSHSNISACIDQSAEHQEGLNYLDAIFVAAFFNSDTPADIPAAVAAAASMLLFFCITLRTTALMLIFSNENFR